MYSESAYDATMTVKMSEMPPQDGVDDKIDKADDVDSVVEERVDMGEDMGDEEDLNVDEESGEKSVTAPVDLSRHLEFDRNRLKFSAFLLRNRSLFSQCGDPPGFLRNPFLGGLLKDKEPDTAFFTYSPDRKTPSPPGEAGPRRGLAFSVENILDPNKFTGGSSSALAALVSRRLPPAACCWRPQDTDSDHDDASGKFI